MKILRCFIENFGVLSKQSVDFDEGLTCIYKENGSGKTTLFVFIKAMLFGIEATTRRNLDENERNKYRPWSGGRYGGWLEFYSETKDRSYRLTRFFGEKESLDSFEIIDLMTSLDAKGDFDSENIGRSMFETDADGFEQTLFLSERNLEIKNSASITQKISALASGDDESYETAIKILDNKRKYYRNNQGRGYLVDLEEKLRERNAELDELLIKSDNAKRLDIEVKEQRDELSRILAQKDLTQIKCEKLSQSLIYKTKSKSLESLNFRKNELLSDLAQINERYKNACVDQADAENVKSKIEKLKRLLVQNESTPQNELKEQIEAIENKFSTNIPTKESILELLQRYSQINGVDLDSLKKETDHALAEYEACKKKVDRESFDENGFEKVQSIKDRIVEQENQKNALTDKYLLMSRQKEGKGDKKAVLALGAALIAVICAMLSLFITPWLWMAFAAFAFVSAAEGVSYSKQRAENLLSERKKQALDLEIQETTELIANLKAEYDVLNARYGDDMRDLVKKCSELECAYMSLSDKYTFERSRVGNELEKIVSELSLYGVHVETDVGQTLIGVSNDLERLNLLRSSLKNAENQQNQRKEQTNVANTELWLQIDSLLSQNEENRDIENAERIYNTIMLDASSYPKIKSELEELERSIEAENLSKSSEGVDLSDVEKSEEQLKTEIVALKNEILDLEHQKEALQARLGKSESTLEALYDRIDDIPNVEQEIEELESKKKTADFEFSTVMKTKEYLEKAKISLLSRYLGAIKDNFEYVYGKIMGEQSADAKLDAKLALKLEIDGSLRDVQYFSRGTRDIMDFSLRIALIKALFRKGEKPIILLDDPFATLDQKHLEIAKKCVGEIANEYQIIYTVCSNERKF